MMAKRFPKQNFYSVGLNLIFVPAIAAKYPFLPKRKPRNEIVQRLEWVQVDSDGKN